MAGVAIHGGFRFEREGRNAGIRPEARSGPGTRHVEAVVPLAALVAVLHELDALDPRLCGALLAREGIAPTGTGPHPSARPDGEGHVVVTGPDRFSLAYDEEPSEVVHRVPAAAVRGFVMDLLLVPVVSRIGDLDAGALARVADIVLPAVDSLRKARGAGIEGAAPGR